MQDGWQSASAYNNAKQRGPAAQGRRGRGGRWHDAGPDFRDARRSQQQPSVSDRGGQQAAAHPSSSFAPQPGFVPQRMVILMGLPGSGTLLDLLWRLIAYIVQPWMFQSCIPQRTIHVQARPRWQCS